MFSLGLFLQTKQSISLCHIDHSIHSQLGGAPFVFNFAQIAFSLFEFICHPWCRGTIRNTASDKWSMLIEDLLQTIVIDSHFGGGGVVCCGSKGRDVRAKLFNVDFL